MNNNKRNQDSEFAALAQGKLPATDLGRVRRQLERESRGLAQEIQQQLQHCGIEIAHIEPAPARLWNRLQAITGRMDNRLTATLRWGLATAIAMILVVGSIVYRHSNEDVPSPAEIAQARAELAIAFSYVQRISSRTDDYMKHEIGHTMQDAIIDGIFLGVTQKQKKG